VESSIGIFDLLKTPHIGGVEFTNMDIRTDCPCNRNQDGKHRYNKDTVIDLLEVDALILGIRDIVEEILPERFGNVKLELCLVAKYVQAVYAYLLIGVDFH
jgi:hypothetical protein